MKRSRARDLQRYFDGELGPRRARQVRGWLEQDPEARGRMQAMESMRTMLQQATADAAEDAQFGTLWARVQSGIEREPPLRFSERLSFWLRRWGIVAATAAAATVLVLVLVLRPSGTLAPDNHAVIESLDVGPEAVSTIFTIAGPGEASDTTVIWVTEMQSGGSGTETEER